jgi:hypothetical protein
MYFYKNLFLAFCMRGLTTKPDYYDVDANTVEVVENKVKLTLKHHDDSRNNLQLRIYVLKNGIFRIIIKDYTKRFRVSIF